MKLSLAAILFASGGLVAATTATATFLRVRSAATPLTETSVQVLTDNLDPLSGAIVRIDNGSTQFVGVTDTDGQTASYALDPTSGVQLTIADKTATGGIALGLIETVTPPVLSNPSEDYHLTAIARTQPFAEPVLVQGLSTSVNNIFPASSHYNHWMVGVPAGSKLRFAMNAAPLLDHESIGQYLAYRGATIDPALVYVRGVALVMPGVQLGTDGLVVGIHLLGDLQNGVTIDAYNFATPPVAVPLGPALNVRIGGVQNDVVYVSVTGGVRKGQLALLARASSGPAAQINIAVDNPPVIIVPPDGGQGGGTAMATGCNGCGHEQIVSSATALASPTSTAAFVTDCEPAVPNPPPDWTCTPPPPSSDCGTPTASGAHTCTIAKMRTERFCRAAGSTLSGSAAITTKFKVVFRLDGTTAIGDSKLSSGGGFEYGVESTKVQTDAWTAAPGASGLGQCMRYFRFTLVCKQAYTGYIDTIGNIFEGNVFINPCSKAVTVNEGCTDTSSSQGVCDRTP